MTEFVFKIDKDKVSLVEVSRRFFSPSEYNQLTDWVNINMFEDNSNVFFIQEILQANRITYYKRLVGNAPIHSIRRGVEIRDSNLLVQGNQLFTCIPGCNHCNNPTTCLECATGYVLDSNKYCLRCGPLCAKCAVPTP